jgi:hypothetical protein
LKVKAKGENEFLSSILSIFRKQSFQGSEWLKDINFEFSNFWSCCRCAKNSIRFAVYIISLFETKKSQIRTKFSLKVLCKTVKKTPAGR